MQLSKNTRHNVLMGIRDTLPLVVAATPFAVVFGALAVSHGLSEWLIMAMSIFVFAGASQFIAITLLASATIFPIILLTVFIVNLRHMLYAASLMQQLTKVPQWLRLPMAFLLTDETYAVASNRAFQQPNKVGFTAYYLGSGIFMYSNWILFTWIGISLGKNIPNITSWGLDIAMIVAFIGIVVPILKRHADWACAITAGVSALLTYDWPHQTGLLFSSFVAIGVGMIISSMEKKAAKND